MTRPSRSNRGVPSAGARVTCRRAALRRTLHAAGVADDAHAARGSIAAAMIEAAHACDCEACPTFLRRAEGNLVFAGTLRREARSAERIGRGATEWSDRTLADRALLQAAEDRSGAVGMKRWHAKRRAEESGNAAIDAAFPVNTNQNETE